MDSKAEKKKLLFSPLRGATRMELLDLFQIDVVLTFLLHRQGEVRVYDDMSNCVMLLFDKLFIPRSPFHLSTALIVVGNPKTLRRGDPDTFGAWIQWADAHGVNMNDPGKPVSLTTNCSVS